MGLCGSRPEGTSPSGGGGSAQAAGPAAPSARAAVHDDIVNDVVRGGESMETVSSSEDGTCVLYDWRRGEVVRQR